MRYLQSNIWKRVLTCGLLLASSLVAQAQNPAPAKGHGIVVRKYSWSSYRPGWDRGKADVIGPVRDATGRINMPVLSRGGQLPRLGYRYKAEIFNGGQRQTRLIVWDYRIIEKETGNIASHRFRSALKLKPGAKAQLKAFSYAQPSKTVSASYAGKKYADAFDEKVVILRVEYVDGSIWAMQ